MKTQIPGVPRLKSLAWVGPKNLHFRQVPGDAADPWATLSSNGLKGFKSLVTLIIRKLRRSRVYPVFCLPLPWWKAKSRWRTMTMRILFN